MNKIYAKVSLLGMLLMSIAAFNADAQTSGDYRTRATFSGHWSSTGSNSVWERFSGGTWINHNGSPTPQSGTLITVRANAFVPINSGATVAPPTGYTLVIEDNAGITFGDASSVLQIPGNLVFDNNGIVNGSISGLGKLQFQTTAAHLVSGNGTISNFEVNTLAGGSVTLGSGENISVTGLLNVVTGTLNTSNGLTLKSSAAGTAAVAPIATGVISGQVNVERYFSDRRGWRLVTAPVTTIPGTIYTQWQNNPNNVGGGVELWGVNTNDGTHGLKAAGAYNLRSFANAYVNIGNTKVPMPDNPAYAMMVTGPWGSNNIGTGEDPTTILTTGTLVTGNKTMSFNTTSDTWGLVANPYASAVDFNEVYLNMGGTPSIERYFWSLDPSLGDFGKYVVVQHVSGTTYSVTPASAQTRMIQSGQSVFMRGLTTNSTINVPFQENDKSPLAANNSLAVFRTNGGGLEQMRVNLFDMSAAAPQLEDGLLINCHETDLSNSFKVSEDIAKFTNQGENLYIVKGSTKLIVEGRELFENGDEVLIGMGGMSQKDYMLEIDPIAMGASGMTATLVDNFLNTQQTISLSTVTNYNFVVTADPASSSVNRFKIVFGNAPTSVNTVVKAEASVTAYPNPVLGETAKLEVTNLEKGTYTISVYNTLGQVMTSQTLNHNGGTATETVNLSTLAPGSYDVKVSDNKGNFETHTKIIKL